MSLTSCFEGRWMDVKIKKGNNVDGNSKMIEEYFIWYTKKQRLHDELFSLTLSDSNTDKERAAELDEQYIAHLRNEPEKPNYKGVLESRFKDIKQIENMANRKNKALDKHIKEIETLIHSLISQSEDLQTFNQLSNDCGAFNGRRNVFKSPKSNEQYYEMLKLIRDLQTI